MKPIKFKELRPIEVQAIIDHESVHTVVENVTAVISEGAFLLTGREITSTDEISVPDFLGLSFNEAVICERREVENAIMFSEYETLKISDDRRGQEVKKLQDGLLLKAAELVKAKKAHTDLAKKLHEQVMVNAQLGSSLALCRMPWYKKLLKKKRGRLKL